MSKDMIGIYLGRILKQKTEEKDDTETLSSTSEIDMEGKVLKETQDDELPEVLMKDEKLPVLNRDPPTEPGHRIDPNSTLPSSKIEKCTNSSFTTPLSKPTKWRSYQQAAIPVKRRQRKRKER